MRVSAEGRIWGQHMTSIPKQQLGSFELLDKLGQGGFTEVLLARDLRHKSYGTLVAIKRLRPGLIQRDPIFLESLLFEAELGMLVNNPHVLRVDGVFEAEGEPHLVMEYVEGYRLDHLMGLAEGRGLLPEVVTEVTRQLCEGLAAIHSAQDADREPLHTVHQDIKPGNILVTRSGVVKVADFNLARPQRGDRPPLWVRQGTPGYRSPEQARGDWKLTPASDLYSVGIVLYELLTGKRLFEGLTGDPERLQARQRQLSATMEIVASRKAPPGLDNILQKLLAYDPADRYSDAREVYDALTWWQQTWNQRFDLKEYLHKRRNALEALASRPQNTKGIQHIDTDLGVRPSNPSMAAPIHRASNPTAAAGAMAAALPPNGDGEAVLPTGVGLNAVNMPLGAGLGASGPRNTDPGGRTGIRPPGGDAPPSASQSLALSARKLLRRLSSPLVGRS